VDAGRSPLKRSVRQLWDVQNDMSATQHRASRNPLRLLMRVPVPWVFVLTYLVGVGVEYAWPTHMAMEALPSVSVAGGVLFVIGAAVAGWGLLTFRRARTTTVPGRSSARLVTWGPYRFSRNPMYVGLTLAYLGEAGILRQVWPVLLLPLTVAYVNWVVIPVEEGKLREIFGEEYERYRARVRRWV
jgi:protein-S-isoprenylcysteine O-methyltransferase Ste14